VLQFKFEAARDIGIADDNFISPCIRRQAEGRRHRPVTDISTVTREQSAGLGQVGAAVHELDRSTQQNAARVEETAAAASTLSDQTSRRTFRNSQGQPIKPDDGR
jgi:hypothetical protein